MTKIEPTINQKHQMIFNASNHPGLTRMTIEEASELLDTFLADISDVETLADNLRYYSYISNFEAVKLAKGEGFIAEGMSDQHWEKYSTRDSR